MDWFARGANGPAGAILPHMSAAMTQRSGGRSGLDAAEEAPHKIGAMQVAMEQLKSLVTRRRALLAGGGGVAAIAVALAASQSGDSRLQALSGVNLAAAKDLGDGFFEVDGWVLTAEDIRKLGGRPSPKAE